MLIAAPLKNPMKQAQDGSTPLGSFPTTAWSRLRAGEGDRSRVLDTLAVRYWPAVVAWLRRGVARDAEQARDLAQSFFVWMLETGFLDKADPERGRFRAFLKTALRRFVIGNERHERAAKRGGEARFVPLTSEAGEPLDPAGETAGPDEALDAAWRAELVSSALARTRAELERRGQPVRYAVFHAFHVDGGADYAQLARSHGISRVDVSNHLARAKSLFREQLRALVLETVGSDEDLRAELGWLLEEQP